MVFPDDRVGAHPAYHDSGRCPLCRVPLLAPHMDSCDYTGVWRGQPPPDDPDDPDDFDDNEDWDD